MYLIIFLYAALLLTACGSDKEPLFRPTVPAAPAQAVTDENADSRAPGKPGAPSSLNRDPDDRYRLFARLR